mmetsp:Transcript_10057/g.23054  ORF Transcript_10057/g.23054 Transcript_10057/m.23054 type:complete len:219 (-) Transcript_10057:676-1332(-)
MRLALALLVLLPPVSLALVAHTIFFVIVLIIHGVVILLVIVVIVVLDPRRSVARVVIIFLIRRPWLVTWAQPVVVVVLVNVRCQLLEPAPGDRGNLRVRLEPEANGKIAANGPHVMPPKRRNEQHIASLELNLVFLGLADERELASIDLIDIDHGVAGQILARVQEGALKRREHGHDLLSGKNAHELLSVFVVQRSDCTGGSHPHVGGLVVQKLSELR